MAQPAGMAGAGAVVIADEEVAEGDSAEDDGKGEEELAGGIILGLSHEWRVIRIATRACLNNPSGRRQEFF